MTRAMQKILESLNELVRSHESEIENVGDKLFKEFKETRKNEIEVSRELINKIEKLL